MWGVQGGLEPGLPWSRKRVRVCLRMSAIDPSKQTGPRKRNSKPVPMQPPSRAGPHSGAAEPTLARSVGTRGRRETSMETAIPSAFPTSGESRVTTSFL